MTLYNRILKKLYLGYFKFKDSCESSENSSFLTITDKYSQEGCPEDYGRKVSLGLLVAYLIMLNVLLVNLLIAIFRFYFSLTLHFFLKIQSFYFSFLIFEATRTRRSSRSRARFGSFSDSLLFTSTSTVRFYPLHSQLSIMFSRLWASFCCLWPVYALKELRTSQDVFVILQSIIKLLIYIIIWEALLKDSMYLSNSEQKRLKLWENFITEQVTSKDLLKIKDSSDYKIQQNTFK
jgi:hypothetical protein